MRRTHRDRSERTNTATPPATVQRVPVRRACSFRFDERSRQQRNHDLVVARNCETLPTCLRVRTLRDVHARPVMLKKVEVDCREIRVRIAEIAYDADGLKKYFRQHDRRADVQVYAAIV